MTIKNPANIVVISNTSTGFSFRFSSTLTSAARLHLLLTPSIYKDFSLIIDAASISSGNNQNNVINLQWSNTIFDSVMRGISYGVSIRLYRSNSDVSEYVPVGIIVKRPFDDTVTGDHLSPGFSISGIGIAPNRISDRIFSTDELEYPGTWRTYPRVVLTGQFNYCKLVNTATGAQVEMNSEVASNYIRVLETNPRHAQYGLYGGADEDSLEYTGMELTRLSNIRNFIFPSSNVLVRPMAIEAYFYNRNVHTALSVTYPVCYFELGENNAEQ